MALSSAWARCFCCIDNEYVGFDGGFYFGAQTGPVLLTNVIAQLTDISFIDDNVLTGGTLRIAADGGDSFPDTFNFVPNSSGNLKLSMAPAPAADVPAPAGLFLLAFGLIGGSLLRRRRQQI